MRQPKHHCTWWRTFEVVGNDLHGGAGLPGASWHLNDESGAWNLQGFVRISVHLGLVIDEVLERFGDDGAVREGMSFNRIASSRGANSELMSGLCVLTMLYLNMFSPSSRNDLAT